MSKQLTYASLNQSSDSGPSLIPPLDSFNFDSHELILPDRIHEHFVNFCDKTLWCHVTLRTFEEGHINMNLPMRRQDQ